MKKDFTFYKSSKPFRIWDLIIIGVILLLVIALLLVLFLPRNYSSGVNIYYKGKMVRTISFNDEQVVEYGGVVIVVKNGQAYVAESNCKNQYCVKHSPISLAGESIICLPNQIIVEVYGGDAQEVDEVTG